MQTKPNEVLNIYRGTVAVLLSVVGFFSGANYFELRADNKTNSVLTTTLTTQMGTVVDEIKVIRKEVWLLRDAINYEKGRADQRFKATSLNDSAWLMDDVTKNIESACDQMDKADSVLYAMRLKRAAK